MSKKLFRQIISQEISQGKQVSFDRVLDKMAIELDCDPSTLIDYKNYYHQIVELGFMTTSLKKNAREIIIHNSIITQEIGGDRIESPFKISNDDFQLMLEVLCAKENIEWNYSNPFASFFWKYESRQYRVTLIHYSCSPRECSKIFFRNIASSPFPIKSFGIEKDMEMKLCELVSTKQNIIIAGSTGSGKSALLASLIETIPPSQHLILMEDTHEISTKIAEHTFLLADPRNSQKSLKAYCAYALRMSPERLVLGEIRSSEIVPFVLSMNTGHKGLMSTIHANSAKDAISRLSVLFCLFSEQKEISYELILKLICSNVDYIVQMDKCRISEIIHILGSDGERPIFELVYSSDKPI